MKMKIVSILKMFNKIFLPEHIITKAPSKYILISEIKSIIITNIIKLRKTGQNIITYIKY